MTDLAPLSLDPPKSALRDRRIAAAAGASVLVHLLVLVWLLWPPPKASEAAPPNSVAVDLVTPRQLAALEPPAPKPQPPATPQPPLPKPAKVVPLPTADSSSEPSSSAEMSSAESSVAQSASEQPSSAASEPPSASASEVSSTTAEPVETSASAAAGPPSEVAAARDQPPTTSGPEPASAPPSALPESPEEPTETTASPSMTAALRPAKHLYAGALLKTPEMATMRQKLEASGSHLNAVQLCNIEAIAQIRQQLPLAAPDMFVANAMTPAQASGQTLTASGAAFRAGGTWYGMAYDCTVAKSFETVTSFSFEIGNAIAPSALGPRLSGLLGVP